MLDWVTDFLDIFIGRRLGLALLAGALAAVAAFATLESPLADRVATLCFAVSIVAGLIWEYRHRHDPD